MNKIKPYLQKYENSSSYLLFLGLLAALFFTAIFIINRLIALDGGHWYWSASLRFVFTLLFLSIGFIAFKGFSYFKMILKEYIDNFKFWSIAGTIGFGLFYTLICYASYFSPAWVIATTFQFTIIASLFVLYFFGKKLSKNVWLVTIMIFIGVTMVNMSHFKMSEIDTILLGFLPVLLAAFLFPIGNQMVWEEKNRRANEGADISLIKNSFVKIFLLILGSFPLWIVLYFFTDAGVPSQEQAISVALIAILSGIIATSIFLYARSLCDTPKKLVIVDSSQSGDVFFALFAEMIFLNVAFPNLIGLLGVALTILGLIFLIKFK